MRRNHVTGKKIAGENGFTLIEVMMAMAVFSVGFLALASMQITATNGNSNARSLMDAVSVLEDHLEYLKNLPNTQEYWDTAPQDYALDSAPGQNPHVEQVRDLVFGTGNERRHFNGTLTWWVYDNNNNPDPDDPMPGTTTDPFPDNAIKIKVRLDWQTLMMNRSLEYTLVRVRDVM